MIITFHTEHSFIFCMIVPVLLAKGSLLIFHHAFIDKESASLEQCIMYVYKITMFPSPQGALGVRGSRMTEGRGRRAPGRPPPPPPQPCTPAPPPAQDNIYIGYTRPGKAPCSGRLPET